MAQPTLTELPPASERSAQVAFAEQQAAENERWLEQEAFRLQEAAGSLLGRVQHLKSTAAQLHLAGMRDPAFVELHRRTQQSAPPKLTTEAVRDRALAARIEAVKVRIRAVEEQRQAVQAHAAELSRLSSQLTADETEVIRFEALKRQRELQPAPIPLTVPRYAPGTALLTQRPSRCSLRGE